MWQLRGSAPRRPPAAGQEHAPPPGVSRPGLSCSRHPETSPGSSVSASSFTSFRWRARPRPRRQDGRALALDLEEHASERAVTEPRPYDVWKLLRSECGRRAYPETATLRILPWADEPT